ncbi:hypothetical protein F2Q69_00029343 [Brassica cretica]|uniref:Uncharacterized protein n=1 Tax=Brassica cretica TaxID=69181 RepID=A0A8S9S8B8_BRACR|nr:hypothetical protein F2Q69_00029343 [Brassica cretica]
MRDEQLSGCHYGLPKMPIQTVLNRAPPPTTSIIYCRNRTTKRTSNGRELERAGVEVARADRCRKHLRAGAVRMTTSWNACKNRLGFKVAG